jgi:hypothetical protein
VNGFEIGTGREKIGDMSRVAGVIAAVIGLLLVTQFFIGRRAPGRGSRGPGGETVLRMRRWRYTSLASLALAPAAIVSWVVLTLRPTPNDWAAVLLASGLVTTCASTGAWCLAAEFRACVRVDPAGLDWVGVLGHRVVEWSEIARFAYNPVNQWFFITLVDGTHLWLWDDLTGIGFFAQMALSRLPPAALWGDHQAREVLQELADDAQVAG